MTLSLHTTKGHDDEIAQLRARVAQLEQEQTLSQRRLAEASLSEQRYRSLTETMPQLIWATDADGRHFYYNRRWYEYTGLSEEQSLGFGFANALHPDDYERTIKHWERAWRNGESYEIEYRFRRHDGVYQWFIGRAIPIRNTEGQLVEWVGTCTDIDEQKRANDVLSFLADASALLSNSLDYETTLAQLTRLAVPHIADWCAIDILEEDGEVRRLGVAHIDPEKLAIAYELQRRIPYDPNAPSGVPYVLRTGQPELVEMIDEDTIRAAITDPEICDMFLALGLCSSMAVPLIARGRVLGAITLVSAESSRQFNESDLRLAQDLARRAAIAIDNSQLYRDQIQFRTTLDQIHDSVFMFDPETLLFSYVNQGAIDQVGYTASELREMTPLDIAPELIEQDFPKTLAQILSGESVLHTFETMHRHKDGRDTPVEVALQYVAGLNAEGRFVAVVRDITERKQTEASLRASEQRYRALADAMPLVVWQADTRGQVVSFNQRWYEYTDREVEHTANLSWKDVLHPDDRERTIKAWEESVQTGKPYEIEYRWKRGSDGLYRWWLGRARLVLDEQGAPSYWVGTGTDIDDQKQSETTLRERSEVLAELTKALESRNSELDQFAYVTSHDLKAPLRGIANLAQWVEEDLGDNASEDIRKHLELLRGRVQRMEALIDGILQFSRVGRSRGAIEHVDVRELLDDVIDLLAPPSNVAFTIATNLPTIKTERLLLQQVFANLIGNAIKHNSDRDLDIRISAKLHDSMYIFAVADNGTGIAPQYHERIFGIFQTLAPRDKVEGSGLGLAMIKKIVEHHRGQVWLESEEGKGATFYFTWPKHNA